MTDLTLSRRAARLLALAGVLTSLGIAGCGGDDKSECEPANGTAGAGATGATGATGEAGSKGGS